MAAEGVFPKIDGDILYASEVNGIHSRVKQIYTGAGFDSSRSGGGGTTTGDHELDAVASSQATYVKIKITGTAKFTKVGGDNIAGDGVKLKAQIKETGGGYADILAFKSIASSVSVALEFIQNTAYTYEIIGTLTAGQKTNGYQIKVFSSTVTAATNTSGSFTNIQTILEEA